MTGQKKRKKIKSSVRQQPVVLGDSSGEKQPGTGQAKGKAALKDRASKQSQAQVQAATAQSCRRGGGGGKGKGGGWGGQVRRGQGMVEKMLAAAKTRKAKPSPPQEASYFGTPVIAVLSTTSSEASLLEEASCDGPQWPLRRIRWRVL
ncbi:uncharacterized protein LOC141936804 isoform X3 [Strix uralensis]